MARKKAINGRRSEAMRRRWRQVKSDKAEIMKEICTQAGFTESKVDAYIQGYLDGKRDSEGKDAKHGNLSS